MGLLAETTRPDVIRDLTGPGLLHGAATTPMLAACLREAAVALAGPSEPALGMASALTVLWSRLHKFDAADPSWPDRDRFVVSSPAAAPLLLALLNLTGHAGAETVNAEPGIGAGARYGAHPAIEATAAPDGQAIAAAVGMALAERVLAARFGKSLVDHRVWAIAAAADLTLGVTHEAMALAGHLRLDRLVLMVDATSAGAEDARARIAACGWAVKQAEAHDAREIEAALSFALRSRKPTLVWCVGGLAAEAERAVLATEENWRRIGLRGSAARRGWLKRMAHHPQRPEFERAMASRLPEHWHEAVAALKQHLKLSSGLAAPAASCHGMIDRLGACMPEMLCGWLDEAQTAAPPGGDCATARIGPGQFGGRHVGYGNRPLGMAACGNGIAVHDGILPFTSASTVQTAAQLPAIRLAALQRRRSIHLAIEHAAPDGGWSCERTPPDLLCSLRAIAHLHVFRPGCAMEAAECLELAIHRSDGPSLLVLAQTALPALRRDLAENRCARGGYVLAEAEGPRRATLIATGAELALAMQARDLLAADNIAVAVVSLPCWALFAGQPADYRRSVLGGTLRIGIEAGSRDGWGRFLAEDDLFVPGGAQAVRLVVRDVKAAAEN